MRNLFSVNDDGVVEVLPQAWILEAFQKVRDKYKENGIASLELGLVYFAADYRSDFLSIKDIKDRVASIMKHIYLHRRINVDDVTYNAIRFYQTNQDTVKIRLIRAVNNAIDKAITTIDGAEVQDLDEIKVLADITAKLPAMLENLESLEKFVKREEKKDAGSVGAGEKGAYEDETD